MILLFTLMATVSAFSSGLNKDQLAEISYYDAGGKLHTAHLQYFIDTNKVQYGVKFGVNLYKIAVADCKVTLPKDMDEYFAAYLTINENCNAQALISELETHGADFIFISAKHGLQTGGKLMSNSYPIPVFFIENNEDVFQLDAVHLGREYINIFFLMVK